MNPVCGQTHTLECSHTTIMYLVLSLEVHNYLTIIEVAMLQLLTPLCVCVCARRVCVSKVHSVETISSRSSNSKSLHVLPYPTCYTLLSSLFILLTNNPSYMVSYR